MRKFLWLIISFISFSPIFGQPLACKQHAVKSAPPPLATLARHIDLVHLDLSIDLDLKQPYFSSAKAAWSFSISELKPIPLYLHENFSVDSVFLDGQPTTFFFANSLLEIPSPSSTTDLHSLEIYYHGQPASLGFGSTGFKKDTAFWTLSEPYGAYSWLPNKEDLLDKIDSLTIRITVPDTLTAVSNGTLIQQASSNGKTTFLRKHRFPIAHYLIAFAVAKYAQQTYSWTYQNQTYYIYNYVFEQDTAAARYHTELMLQFYPYLWEKFGQYPFHPEPYGQAQFGWTGGMEHQTMTFVGTWSAELLVHELAHQWFGNLITCATWQDLWLNEGFATYLSGLFFENVLPEWWYHYKYVRRKAIISSPEGSVFATDTASVPELFSGRLRYAKAAMVLHQLRFIMGDTAFFQAIQDYLRDPILQFRNATTQDLLRHLQNHTSFDLNTYFQQWIYGQGFPHFKLTYQLHEPSNSLILRLYQNNTLPSEHWFDIPIPLKIYTTNGVFDTTLYFPDCQTYHIIPNITALDSIVIDPDIWIIADPNSSVIQVQSDAVVFPSPAYSSIFIALDKPQFIRIYDGIGRFVWKGNYNPFTPIDVQDWKPGVYFIITQDGKSYKWLKL